MKDNQHVKNSSDAIYLYSNICVNLHFNYPYFILCKTKEV